MGRVLLNLIVDVGGAWAQSPEVKTQERLGLGNSTQRETREPEREKRAARCTQQDVQGQALTGG